MARPLRILLADDFEEWRGVIRAILEANPECEIVFEACDGLEAVQQAAQLEPDVVLLDLSMPTLNGIDAAKIIRQKCPRCRIIFVTENADSDIRNAAMETGASGYVIKANAGRELLVTIFQVARRNS